MNALERLLTDPRPPRLRSPWGDVQFKERIADGVTFVATGSHGGLMLDADTQSRLPREVRDCFLNGHGWAEEDCEAPIVLTLRNEMKKEKARGQIPCSVDNSFWPFSGLPGSRQRGKQALNRQVCILGRSEGFSSPGGLPPKKKGKPEGSPFHTQQPRTGAAPQPSGPQPMGESQWILQR